MIASQQSDIMSTLCFIAALAARSVQLILCDSKPHTLLYHCARLQFGPFVMGFITLQPSLLLTKRLWLELRAARSQTDAANNEVRLEHARRCLPTARRTAAHALDDCRPCP